MAPGFPFHFKKWLPTSISRPFPQQLEYLLLSRCYLNFVVAYNFKELRFQGSKAIQLGYFLLVLIDC